MNIFLFLTQPAITFAHEHVQEPDIDEQENVFIDEWKYQTWSLVRIVMLICHGQNTSYHILNGLNHE